MSAFVFFVQLEPDVDHLAPVIYRLNRDLPGSASVICVNPLFEIQEDYRLRFLREEGVKVTYLSELGGKESWKFKLVRALTRAPRFLLRLVPQRVWNFIYFDLKFVSASALHNFFLEKNIRVVTLDDSFPLHRAQALLSAAQELGLRTVRITPANHVRSGIKSSVKPDGLPINFQFRPHLLSPDGKLCVGETEELVLGCMRYCDEWEKVNEALLAKLMSEAPLPPAGSGLKVVVFERTTKGFTGEHSSIRKMKALENTQVVMRGRPRMIRPRKLFAGTQDALPSALLIQWADVVVSSVTSIALDALYYRKPLLYLKYIAEDEATLYEKFGACWKINSETELMAALEQLRSNLQQVPYTDESVEKYRVQVVSRGEPGYDVLGGYSAFYRSLLGS